MSDIHLIFQLFFGLLAVASVITLIIGIVLYVFQAIGMYSISKRRQLGKSGFAWVPVLNMIKFGEISDDAVLNKSGKKPHMRILLPVFCVVGVIVTLIGTFVFILSTNFYSLNIMNHLSTFQEFATYLRRTAAITSQAGLIIALILFILGMLLYTVSQVMLFICCFHIFRSTSTKYVAMFILSLVFPVLLPIFLFAVRRNDNPVWYVPGRNQETE